MNGSAHGDPAPGMSGERFLRLLDAAEYLAAHIHEAPVWIVPCLEGGTPTRASGSSIYTAVLSMLLAALKGDRDSPWRFGGSGRMRTHGSRRGFATLWASGSCSRSGSCRRDPAPPKEHMPERRKGNELFVMQCWGEEAPEAPCRD
jgi:hypothetical protein